MKKSLCQVRSAVVTILLCSAFLLAGCFTDEESNTGSSEGLVRVGVTQIVTHPGIDEVRIGFLEEMSNRGYVEGESVSYEFTNANGDIAQARAIADRFAAGDFDLVFSISTPSSQACAEALDGTGTPLVFGAITDPVAAGLVENFEEPGRYITGSADVWPIGAQLDLLLRVLPNVQRLGVAFNPGETNAVASMKMLEDEATQRNIELITVPVASSGEVPAAISSLVGRVDALYIPADNTVISALGAVVAISERSGTPLMPGDTSNVEVGGFGTIGHSYRNVGAVSGAIAARILNGESPETIPVQVSEVREYYFNLRSAKATGVKIPEELLKSAEKVYE